MATALLRAGDGKRWMILNGLNDGLPSRSLRQSLIAVANTRVASNGAQPADKTEPPKPESRFESVTSAIPLPSLPPSQNRDPKQQATDVPGGARNAVRAKPPIALKMGGEGLLTPGKSTIRGWGFYHSNPLGCWK